MVAAIKEGGKLEDFLIDKAATTSAKKQRKVMTDKIQCEQAMPVVGFLRPGSPELNAHLVTAFRKGMGETGCTEGRNVAIEYRWADNDHQLTELAADLVRLRVAVIATPKHGRGGCGKIRNHDHSSRLRRRRYLLWCPKQARLAAGWRPAQVVDVTLRPRFVFEADALRADPRSAPAASTTPEYL